MNLQQKIDLNINRCLLKTGWFEIMNGRHVYPQTCFSELALYKFNSACWSRTKRTSSSSHWKLTCTRHNITENLLRWRQTITCICEGCHFTAHPIICEGCHFTAHPVICEGYHFTAHPVICEGWHFTHICFSYFKIEIWNCSDNLVMLCVPFNSNNGE
jgi:hypothetical protein